MCGVTANQQRAVAPSPVLSSGGSSLRQRRVAIVQRGWKLQPPGSFDKSGG
jgi:hypothetical protein